MGPRRQSNFRPRTVQGVTATTGGTPAQLCTFPPRLRQPGHPPEDPSRLPPAPARGARGPSYRNPTAAPRQRRMIANLPFGSGDHDRIASPAHPPHVSALSRPGTRPGIRPVMPRPRRSTGQDGAGFPLPFGCRPWLLEASCPARGFRPSYDRPTAPADSADPSGVSMFRTRETRLGPGALFTPGTAVPTRPVNLPDRRTPTFTGQSLFTPVNHPAPRCNCDEASSRVHWRSPLPAFPSPVIPGTVRGPPGFPLSSAPS